MSSRVPAMCAIAPSPLTRVTSEEAAPTRGIEIQRDIPLLPGALAIEVPSDQHDAAAEAKESRGLEAPSWKVTLVSHAGLAESSFATMTPRGLSEGVRVCERGCV